MTSRYGFSQQPGPQRMLINISRGSVVDEKALLAVLRNKTIAGSRIVFAA